ncbi:MAG: hypothetical protein PHN31_05635 [Candidatus Gracilibacteria bacterium]|nr:hypothetical protein [Candidatus Gracilibacteria bacterium]
MNNIFDPTKATYLEEPNDQKNYELSFLVGERYFQSNQDVQYFTSLLCNGILNVSQIVVKGKNNISIPINIKQVQEKLSYQEILSDLVLYELITGEEDRSLLPVSGEKTLGSVGPHNCIIFREGNYSIFDIYDFGKKIDENDVLRQIVYTIRNLYDNNYLDEIDFFDQLFLSPEENPSVSIGKQGFFQRMQSKIDEFLNRYDGEEGKKFFIIQKLHSCPEEEKDVIDERYEELIYTLKNVKKVISQDNIREKAIYYICTDYKLIKNDFLAHLSKTKELFRQILFIFKTKVKEIIL